MENTYNHVSLPIISNKKSKNVKSAPNLLKNNRMIDIRSSGVNDLTDDMLSNIARNLPDSSVKFSTTRKSLKSPKKEFKSGSINPDTPPNLTKGIIYVYLIIYLF
jgi:hypothetical protein